MKGSFNKIQNIKGFSLVEMILSILAVGILSLTAAYVLQPWARNYSNAANKGTTHDDVRFAFERMSREIQGIKQGNIGPTISSTDLDFTDGDSTATDYHLTGTTLYRGNDKLLTNVTSLAFTYYDSTGAVTATAANVRRVQVVLAADPSGDAQAVNLRTDIFLRNYAYDNYQ